MKNDRQAKMSKEERKKRLFGQTGNNGVQQTVTLMGHWNNDSGCRLN